MTHARFCRTYCKHYIASTMDCDESSYFRRVTKCGARTVGLGINHLGRGEAGALERRLQESALC